MTMARHRHSGQMAPGHSTRAIIGRAITPAAVLFVHEARNFFMSVFGYRKSWYLTAALSVVCGALGAAEEVNLLDRAPALFLMLEAILVIGTVAAIIISVDVMAGERERGGLLPLLLTPMSRGAIMMGKLGAAFAAWLATMTLSIPAIWALSGAGMPWERSFTTLLLHATPLVIGFAALALALSASFERKRSALTASLALFAVLGGPLLFGAALGNSIGGRVLDAIDPVYAVAHVLRAIVIEKQAFLAQGFSVVTLVSFLTFALVFALFCSRRLSR